jgi:hypothetical protein
MRLEIVQGLGAALTGDDLVLNPQEVMNRAQDPHLVVNHQEFRSGSFRLHTRTFLMS